MSKELALQDFTDQQMELIKGTVAKGATTDELKLFLYRCKNLGLDPLKTGQIYFVKYGTNPGTIVVGLDGFRILAAKTGKHAGTERGVVRDDTGKCIGAWCKVYHKNWEHPATEEVSRHEYDTGKAMWAKMPETMLKKVAECAALRMAFPQTMGDIHIAEELERVNAPREASKVAREAIAAPIPALPANAFMIDPDAPEKLEDYVFKTGVGRKGKRIKDLTRGKLEEILAHYEAESEERKVWPPEVQEDFYFISAFLGESRDAGN